MEAAEIDRVNPYDAPEKQVLEQKLQTDTHLEHQTHDTIQNEQHLADSAQSAGYGHTRTDERIHQLEDTEQKMGANVVQDQQNIDHWDHEHPDGGYPPSADAAATDGAEDSTTASSNDSGDE